MNHIIPLPKTPITIRLATLADVPAIDALQKKYNKQLGFFPRAQMEGYIKGGWMIVAEDASLNVVGFCASRDRYLKRDELGAIFQLCVAEGSQRKFVGMTLLKYVFDQAPYGCRLFCCWCAQDLAANRFWESMGFVPLAFRAGARGKGPGGKARVHIFWQKRIGAGDETTPYWFPSQTSSGSIREDRIVLPIPPGTHWSDAKPMILPGEESVKTQAPTRKQIAEGQSSGKNSRPSATKVPVIKRTAIVLGGLRLMPVKAAPVAKPQREPRRKVKHDPRFIAAARELRDRWLEQVNDRAALPAVRGKYNVARQMVHTDPPMQIISEQRLIAA